MRAQGFIRARIDGHVLELDTDIQFNPKQKHTIEVVVDRIKIRDDLGLRLAESLETTLQLAEGVAIAAPMDDDSTAEITFHQNLPVINVAMPYLNWSRAYFHLTAHTVHAVGVMALAPSSFSMHNG